MTKPKPKYEVKKPEPDAQSAAPTPTLPEETKMEEPSAEVQFDSNPEKSTPSAPEEVKVAQFVEKSTDVATPSESTPEENKQEVQSSLPIDSSDENPLPRHPVLPVSATTPSPSQPLTTAPSKSVVGTEADGEEEDYEFVGKVREGGSVYKNIKTGEKVFTDKMVAIGRKARVYPFPDKTVDANKKVVIS